MNGNHSMDYDEVNLDFFTFFNGLEKEKNWQKVMKKLRSEREHIEQLHNHQGPGTARIREKGPDYVRQLKCLYESVLTGNLAKIIMDRMIIINDQNSLVFAQQREKTFS